MGNWPAAIQTMDVNVSYPFVWLVFYLRNRKCFKIKKDQSFIKIGQEGPETEDRSDKLHEKFNTEPTQEMRFFFFF